MIYCRVEGASPLAEPVVVTMPNEGAALVRDGERVSLRYIYDAEQHPPRHYNPPPMFGLRPMREL